MNYMMWPHLHFSGTFLADVPTVNNVPSPYDTDSFVPAYQLEDLNNWNPKGTGEWSVSGSVTHVCYADGMCVGDDEEDKHIEPIMGAQFLGKVHNFTYVSVLLNLRTSKCNRMRN